MPVGSYAPLRSHHIILRYCESNMAVCVSPSFVDRTSVIPTAPSAALGSPLLADCGTMTLRVHGPGQSGKLVHIRSPKCTIGSAPGCTLRLVASGVEPLQCWVLRGKRGVVVRRLQGTAAINGRRLEEARIQPGDRLRIGSVELEFVELGEDANRGDECEPAVTIAPPTATASELESKLAAALDQLQRVEGQARQGFQASITAAERADQLRDALAAADQQLEEISRELATARQTATQRTAELDAVRRQLGNQQELLAQLELAHRESESLSADQSRMQNELGQTRFALQEEQAAWEAKQSAWQIEQSRWQAERALLEQRLGQRDAELAAVRQSAAAQAGVMTVPLVNPVIQDEAAQTRCTELEGQLAECQSQLEQLRQQLGRQAELQECCDKLSRDFDLKCRELAEMQAREAANARRARCEAELNERAESLARWHEELTQRSQQLTTAERDQEQHRQSAEIERDALAADRERLEIARSEFDKQQQLALEQQRCADAQVALDARQSAAAQQDEHAEQTQRLADELEALRARLAAEQTAMQQSAEQLSQAEQQLEAERRQCQLRVEELDARQAEIDRQAAQLAEREQALLHSAAGLSVAAEVARQSSAAENGSAPLAPLAAGEVQAESDNRDSKSVDSVLSRLMQAGVWRQDGQSGDDAAPEPSIRETYVPASPVVALAHADDGLASEPRRPVASPPLGGGDDEESIESYMHRLMQRVRGDSDTAHSAPLSPARWQPAPPAPAEKQPVPESVVVQPVAATVDPSQYVPRSMAPELGSDLSAMRELANSAARSAIDRHIRRRTQQQATGKLFGACLSLTTGLVLWYWAWKTKSFSAASAAALGCALGGSWVVAALRRVAKVRQLNNLEGAPEAAADSGSPQ